MSERKITFPVVAKGIRRNAETGVYIVTLAFFGASTGQYEVRYPTRNGYAVAETPDSLAHARAIATDLVEQMRRNIATAYDEAQAEDAERDYQNADMTEVEAHKATVVAEATAEFTEYARKQFPSVAAMIENAPAGSAHGPADLREDTAPTLDDYEATEDGYRHKTAPFEIVAHRFFDGPITGYEVRRTGHDFRLGYIVLGQVSGLTAAMDVVASHIVTDAKRAAAGETFVEMLARHLDEQAQALGPKLPEGVELIEFGAADIRAMVNDACRIMDAPEAWRKDEADA